MTTGSDSDPSPEAAEASPRATPAATVPLPPGAARRRELRQQRRAERWRNLWRLVVFSGLSAGLATVLLRQGWMLQSPSQVEVSGSRMVSREQVIQAGQLRFPLPLLALRPRELRATLSAALPVEQVRVSRWMLPPRLRVELVDRQALARAQRRGLHGPEPGFIDRVGNWIDQRQSAGLAIQPHSDIMVIGWQERHRPALAAVLANRALIGPGLKEVRFDESGDLWLTTRELGSLRLGPVDGQLRRRLEVASHLNRTLPAQIRGKRPEWIDLSDPEQPELSLAGAVRILDEGSPATARRPPGGQ
ncbi:FtsQ-type POTRA domain-containing protein [Synechococcus sp. CBW1004]|jgi:cell division protein FtsQ|nr:FtsQ-type POTRA domain-containing protein [Synechococcus sp. CBW1004]